VAVSDYLDGRIKVHEHTLSAREEMFKDYLSVTKFNAEPVLTGFTLIKLANLCPKLGGKKEKEKK